MQNQPQVITVQHALQGNALHMERHVECNKTGHFQRACRSRRTLAVNDVEQETLQDNTSEDIKTVNLNSVQFNKNCSILTANLKMSANQNTIIVPYKIDTGSNGNIMPAHMFKRLFPKVADEQLAASRNRHILLKHITKLQ